MSSLPPKWKLARLNQLGRWIGGGTPSKANPGFWVTEGIPWVSPKDMKKLYLDDAEDHITENAVEQSSTNVVAEGSVLVVTRSGILSHTLPVAKALRPLAINQDMKALIPDKEVSSDYVLHALRAMEPRILQECSKSGTTVANLDTDRFLNFQIPLPPLEIQLHLVAQLEGLFARSKSAREELTRVPRLVERYKQAILAAAFRGDLTEDWRDKRASTVKNTLEEVARARSAYFKHEGRTEKPPAPSSWEPAIGLPNGWSWVSVDQIATLVQYGTSAKTSDVLTDGVSVLRMGNIVDGNLDYRSLKYLPKNHSEFPELLLKNGDILFNRTNSAELVGKTAVYFDTGHSTSFASYLIRIRVIGYLPELLSAYVNSAFGRDWVRSVVNQQVGQANVNGTKLRELGVPLPPMDEQKQMWSRVKKAFAAIDHVETEATRATEFLDRLDQATLAKAFRGELVCLCEASS